MRRYEVIFSAGADADFDSILFHIAADSPLRAISYIDELRQRTVDFLSSTPKGGTAVGSHRYMVAGSYVVVYLIDESAGTVTVVMVTEGHRNWRPMFGGE